MGQKQLGGTCWPGWASFHAVRLTLLRPRLPAQDLIKATLLYI